MKFGLKTFLCLSLVFTLIDAVAYAANDAWVGEGADANWGTVANWAAGAAPSNNDNLVFGAASLEDDTNNVSNLTIGFLTFTNGGFTLNGNGLTLNPGSPGIITNTLGTNLITLPLTITPAAKYWAVAANTEVRLSGAIIDNAASGTSAGWLCLTNGGVVRILGNAVSARGMDLFQGTVIVDGGLVNATNDGIRFKPPTGWTAGVQLTNHGTIRIGGGGNFRLGHNGTGIGGIAGAGSLSEMDLSSGTLELYGPATSVLVGDLVAGAVGVFNQNGGLVWGSGGSGNTVTIGNSGGAEGTYNLNGGTLWIAAVQANAGAAISAFNFNGGTLKPTVSSATFLQGLKAANVEDGGAVIDTTNFNITIAQSLLAGGAGGLVKLGAGTLTLSGTNTYSGNTIVSNGTLNIIGGLTGGGSVNVQSGTLSGPGTVQGAVMVQPGGTLSPGGIAGVPTELNVAGGLTLAGNVVIEVNKSLALSNDTVNVGGLSGNTGTGTLTVANVGPGLAVGDAFQVFSQPLANGGALTILPASPAPGGAWSNHLAMDGGISIVPVPIIGTPADLTNLTLSAGTLTPSFASNIVSYTAVVVYTNTSLTLTPTSLFPNSSIQVVAGGTTNAVASGTASAAIPLNPGTNVVNIQVTSPDGSATKTYTISLVRVPPNVVLILADDQGFSDWSCYGSEIQTPNLDSLANSGLRFRNFYNAARCSPTRCAILTGLYTQQAAVDPSASLPTMRTDNNITIAELLGANGYRTYMAGKWHLGGGTGQNPWERGFQEFWGFYSGSDDHEDEWNTNLYTLVSPDGAITNISYAPGQFYQPDAIGDYCLQFLNSHYTQYTNRPFFLYVPFGSAHYDLQAPQTMVDTNVALYTNGWDTVRYQRYTNMLAQGVIDSRYALSPNEGTGNWVDGPVAPEPIPAWNTLDTNHQADLSRRMAVYASMIEKMDANIGRIVQRLQQQGQLDNTLVIALSDNGGNFEGGVYGQTGGMNDGPPLTGANLENMGLSGQPYVWLGGGWAHVSNTPFRLFKHYDHNGGIGTPFIVHWPQGVSRTNQWENQPGHIIDVMATIADVTGVSYPTQFNGHVVWPMQGQSLRPLFTNSQAGVPRSLGFEHEGNRAYISDNWKFVTKNFTTYNYNSPANELELYDLRTDPSETTNLAYVQPTVLAQMETNWNNWCSYVGDPSSLLLTSSNNSLLQAPLNPASGTNDLFVDTFNRPDNTNISASAAGMWGSDVPPIGAGAAYYEGYEGSGLPSSIEIIDGTLWMAVGPGMAENGIMQNFVGQDIIDAGGFSVELNVQDINTDPSDPTNRYVGFGVGLTQAQAATGGDVSDPLPPGAVAFRGEVGGNPGASAFFVELDLNGNIKVWSNGVLLDSVPVGQNTGLLTASFACTGFTTNDTVTVSVFFNGQLVDINSPDTNSVSRNFHWNQNNSNYIGLSARASNYAQMDNLAIRKLPLAYDLATDYAMSYGLTGTNAAPNADPDGDGVSNFGEWAFGGNPTMPDSYIASFQDIRVLPGNDFRFEFQRYKDFAAVGLNYHFLTSTDLVNWTEVAPNLLSTSFNEDKTEYEVVTYEMPASVTAGQNQLFLRILADTTH